MYSWDDQEFANIIWGETDDHIVPYPEASEGKSQSDFVYRDNNGAHDESANVKLFEQKPPATSMLHGAKQESNDASRGRDGNWMGNKTDLEKVSEISKAHNEDRELGDIISNTWANIGSSNDLDCIFSNDASVDHASLDRTDELWTSSRDAAKPSSLPLDSTSWGMEPIQNSSGQFGFNTEYLHSRSESYANRFEKPEDSACYTQERLHSSFGDGDIDGTTSTNLVLEKTALNVTRKTISKPQVAARKVASTSKSSKLENMPHQSSCLPHQHFSNPYLSAYSDGNLSDQCMSVLPEADEKHQPVLTNPEACLSERALMVTSHDTPMQSQSMTPKEKIEKLRRRQQMRALLGIKKQQQQLSNPVQITDYSNAQKRSEDDQVLHGSSAVSMEEVDHNVEDTVLYKLQHVVTKLDTQMRLSIRDSLFRLGQSAMQRNYARGSSCGSRHDGCEPDISKETISNHESFMDTESAETETNCIDRAVAHLLFHQPHKSTSNHTRTPSNVPLSFVTKASENDHKTSTQEDLSEQSQTDTCLNRNMKQKMLESAD